MKKIILSVITLFGLFFSTLYAEGVINSGWKNLYLSSSAENISKLVFINNDMYAFASEQGLLKSSDNGKTWKSMNEGLPTSELKGIVDLVANKKGSLLLATDLRALYQWNINNKKWEKIEASGFPVSEKVHMASMIQDSEGTLYSSFYDKDSFCDCEMADVYKSIDHGLTWIKLDLKSALLNNYYGPSCYYNLLLQTKLILDDRDNLYVKGMTMISMNQENPDTRSFLFKLPKGQVTWMNTGYSNRDAVPNDIFVTSSGLLGILVDSGEVKIEDLQPQNNRQLAVRRSWTFLPPKSEITSPISVIHRDSLYMVARSSNNYLSLYKLSNINKYQSQWILMEKSNDSLYPTYLVIHNNKLYAVGKRLIGNDVNRPQGSIDVFEER